MAPMDPTDSTLSEERPSAPRKRTPWIIAGALVVVVAVLAVALATRGGDEDPVPPGVPSVDVTVTIPAGGSIQAAVDAAEPGTTFKLAAGLHREQQVTPRPGDVFEGVGDETVLSGARVLEGWESGPTGWSVGGQTQEGVQHGQCRPESPRCDRPEELFIDGQRLRHVASLADVAPDTWSFDYAADRIHIGVDPAGRLVETSVTPFAFRSDAAGVVIRDLVVTHYATQTQYGTIHAAGTDWTIEGVTSIDNHATGMFLNGDR
ncbi:MAG TPA: hypothetical protein VIY72_01030, partial [Acidimicrobiales bacterium]